MKSMKRRGFHYCTDVILSYSRLKTPNRTQLKVFEWKCNYSIRFRIPAHCHVYVMDIDLQPGDDQMDGRSPIMQYHFTTFNTSQQGKILFLNIWPIFVKNCNIFFSELFQTQARERLENVMPSLIWLYQKSNEWVYKTGILHPKFLDEHFFLKSYTPLLHCLIF